jgi:hypothetical protein
MFNPWPTASFILLAICICLGAMCLSGCASDPRSTPPDCRGDGLHWCAS